MGFQSSRVHQANVTDSQGVGKKREIPAISSNRGDKRSWNPGVALVARSRRVEDWLGSGRSLGMANAGIRNVSNLTRWFALGVLLFAGSSLAGAEKAAAALKADKVVVYKTVAGTKLTLHVFEPEGFKPSDKRPAIVFFFGGGWNGGSPTQFFPQCEYLASRGMVAMSADYRVKSRNKTTPKECVMDGKSAIRWIRKHSAELGVDPEKLAAGGGSAGGHVAAATGNVKGFEEESDERSISSKPDALALFNPVYDNGPSGYGHDRVKDYWESFSPMHNISKNSPPTIVFLGTKDKLIPVATAEEYKKRMEAVGGRCDLHLYLGQPHGFFNVKKAHGTKYLDETMGSLDEFLVSLDFLEKKD